jgi:threonine dehydrogenase-like Zn-dependent dehydrogenase
MNLPPPINSGQILVHESTGTIGRLGATTYSVGDGSDTVVVELIVKDRSRRKFRYAECRKANATEIYELQRSH